ncbi:MAG: LPXTG cell wall anchor domain-containing protein [Hespellia sp.]|nr:LPXTG cell wall anchor domain-containing protein [Hespellia sp.]
MKRFRTIGSKIMASLLTLILMLSLVSLPVQAAGDEISWDDVQAVINNATAGEVIDLTKLENTNADTTLVISKDITLQGSFTGTEYSTHQIFNLFITITDNANVTVKNLAIENKVPTKSVVSGNGNLIVDNSDIESSTRNDVVTSYDPVATVELDGDVTVLGNIVGGNETEESSGRVIGATILDRDGEHTGTAGIAIKAVNVTVSGGFVVGGTSFESGCNSGDGIVASGDITILNGYVQSGYGGQIVGVPIRFTDGSTTQQTLLVNNAKVLGNGRIATGQAAPYTIFMKDTDIAIIDNSTIGWYTDIPLFSAGSYSVTNPVNTWGTFANGIEVFKITSTKASLTNVKTVVNDTVTSYYAANDTEVTVSANVAETGMVFDKWVSSDIIFEEVGNSTTTFRMPAKEVAVEATYKDEPHTHTAGTEWYKDNTNHWHLCTAGDNEKMDISVHSFGDWVIDKEATATTAGSKHRECVCGQIETTEIPATGVIAEKPDIGKNDTVMKDTATPKTGDNSNTMLYLSLVLLSGGAVVFVFKRKSNSINNAVR